MYNYLNYMKEKFSNNPYSSYANYYIMFLSDPIILCSVYFD